MGGERVERFYYLSLRWMEQEPQKGPQQNDPFGASLSACMKQPPLMHTYDFKYSNIFFARGVEVIYAFCRWNIVSHADMQRLQSLFNGPTLGPTKISN